MGQRLVITIQNGEEELAKAYYHWSGYTAPTLKTASMAVQHFDEISVNAMTIASFCRLLTGSTPEVGKKRGKLLMACQMLFETGAGLAVADGEHEKFETLFPTITPYIAGNNRNEGLIAFTKEIMDQFQKMSEGDIHIDIANKTVDVSNFFWNMEVEEGLNHNLEEPFCNLGYDLCNVSFKDMENLTEIVCNAIDNGTYLFMENDELLTAVV